MDSHQDGFFIEPEFELSITSVLSQSWAVLTEYPVFFLGLSFIINLPNLFIEGSGGVGGFLLSSILPLIGQGTVTYAVFKAIQGSEFSVADSLGHGLSRLGTMVLVSLLMGLAVFLLALIGVFILGSIYDISLGLAIVVGLAMALGVVFVLLRLSVVIQACVVEKAGATESIQRSMDLTSDNCLRIFGLFFIVIAVTGLFGVLAGFFIAHFIDNIFLAKIPEFILLTVSTTFIWIMTCVIYLHLRRIKEGMTIDGLVDIFD